MNLENIKNVKNTILDKEFDINTGDLFLIKGEIRYYDSKQDFGAYDGKYGFVGVKNYNDVNLTREVNDHPLNALLFNTEEDAYLAAKEMEIFEPMTFQVKELLTPAYVIVVELYLDEFPITLTTNIVWTYNRIEPERKIGATGHEAMAYWFDMDQYDAFVAKLNELKAVCLNTLYNFVMKTTKEQPFSKLNVEDYLVV